LTWKPVQILLTFPPLYLSANNKDSFHVGGKKHIYLKYTPQCAWENRTFGPSVCVLKVIYILYSFNKAGWAYCNSRTSRRRRYAHDHTWADVDVLLCKKKKGYYIAYNIYQNNDGRTHITLLLHSLWIRGIQNRLYSTRFGYAAQKTKHINQMWLYYFIVSIQTCKDKKMGTIFIIFFPEITSTAICRYNKLL
jgi:hypothetical protein